MKKKFLFPITILSLLISSSACSFSGTSMISSESKENSSSSSDVSSVDSKADSSQPSSNKSSETSKQSSNSTSVASGDIVYDDISKIDSGKIVPIQKKATEQVNETFVPDSYQLQSDSHTCDTHELKKEIIRPATIIQKGIERNICEKCGGFEEKFFYDLNEFAFENATFVYDGSDHELMISGLLPYGCTVKYENNKLKEKGEKEATAFVYDENNNLIETKTAKISVIENIGLPALKVETETREDPSYKDKKNYTKMTLTIDNCDSKYAKKGISGGIRVRGNSTNQADVSKRAWRFKFDSKTNLLGLHNGEKFKSWVVLADYFDNSTYRNLTAFSIGNSLFNYSGNYCTSYQHVNLYMNGNYRGVYLLAEQQQANKNRINVAEPEDEDTTEKLGYIVEIDGIASHEDWYFDAGPKKIEDTSSAITASPKGFNWPGWGGGGGISVNGVSISSKSYAVKTDVYDQKQVDYIKKYIQNVQSAFVSAVNNGPLKVLDENNDLIDSPYDNQYDTLNSFIDLDSVFRTYVLQEFMKNYDCGWGSFYLWVDFSKNAKYPRCTLGAPWDFDLGSGNKNNQGSYKPTGDFITKVGNSMTEFNPWLYLLSQTDFFKDMFKKYYSVFANSGIYEKTMNFIEYEGNAFAADFGRNFTRWKDGTGKTSMGTRQYTTHGDAVNYLLDWFSQRKTYLDSTYLK